MLNLRISDDLFKRLEEVAADERATRTEAVVNLLTQALDSRESEIAALTERVVSDRAELFARLA